MGDAARGESGGIGSIASGSAARRPYSNQRCGFRVAKAGGVIKQSIALCLSQPLSQSALRRIASSPAGEPFGAPYKLRHKTNTGTAYRPHSFTISSAHPPSGGFHMAEPYFTLRKQYFTAHQRNFPAREACYFPTQKRENILSITSDVTSRPVIWPRA